MADQTTHTHYTERNNVERTRSSGALAFIVGALVVAVALIAYFVFGGGVEMGAETAAPAVEVNTSAESAAGADATDDAAGATATADTADDSAATDGAAASAGAEATENDAAAAAGATSDQ